MKTERLHVRCGFTWVEIVLIVAILVIVAALLILQFTEEPVHDWNEDVLSRLPANVRKVTIRPCEHMEGRCSIEYWVRGLSDSLGTMYVPMDEFDPNCLSRLKLVRHERTTSREIWRILTVQEQVLEKLREEDARQVMLEPVTEDICNILYLIEDSNVVYHISDVPNKEFDPESLSEIGLVESDKSRPGRKIWVRPGTEKIPGEAPEPS